MKTNYLPRSRKSGRTKKALLIIAIFIAAVVVFDFSSGALVRLISPVWKGRNFIGNTVSDISQYWRSKSSLIKENTELKDKVASYESLIISARSISKKNEELLSILGRSEEPRGTLAGVISRPPQTPYDVLLVDAGSNTGVTTSMRVYTDEGYALGKVSEVYANSSRVELYTLPGEKTDAVMERDMTAVILEGEGGGNFKVALPRDMTVVEGDRILLAGTSGRLVAVVGNVSLKPTDSFKEVIAHSPIGLSKITSVFISR